jgi:DHA1 family bicyclomycin/chloramphenicol resistance-like MFS transporter
MMCLTALSTDAMLPALPEIGSELGVRTENQRQLVVSTIFLGMAFGQLFFGPLSDQTGRKPAVFLGYSLYLGGTIISATAVDFPTLLAGRVLQGLGISAPRAVMLALVRDLYEGRRMAQVMSFASSVLILVPMLAPTLGQSIIQFSSWRGIFVFYLIFAGLTLLWFALRMPETLADENRKRLSPRLLLNSTGEILANRTSLGYTVTAGLISGAFLGYLSSSQQIFQEQYALGTHFPLFFAIIALAIGLASLLNTRLVLRYGMRKLVRWSLALIFSLNLVGVGTVMHYSGQPPLGLLMAFLMLTFFSIGILFGNQNTLAMEPLGHLAGIGSAIVGSLSTLISMPLGTLIGQAYNGTVTPLVIGIAVLSGISLAIVHWIESRSEVQLAI